jgi:hypothetical protein
MEIIQEMTNGSKGIDMYTKFKENLIIYLKQKSLPITKLISDKIQIDFKQKKIDEKQMNTKKIRIEKLQEIFNSNGFKNNIHKGIGKKLLFTEKATQDFFVDFINDMGWEEIYQHINSQSTIDNSARDQAIKFKQGMN